ncbi:glycosyl hydrolase 53 family protein [Alicyclobacillus mengziensis]|uniref:Arabinogalactan endo-beta-1,4-galactanase n=1 Tax=Alicyclobacillus mengziensis TaxID=2931921 RepID=A0A9X7Z7N9_9BACL|nr:glycosyl hydrolase 53 family protein [Alicyclobacillus mengziensis]QSO47418.1 glycosyl hydrolase 53 family protein [Alicyclobacillus mengziensis]
MPRQLKQAIRAIAATTLSTVFLITSYPITSHADVTPPRHVTTPDTTTVTPSLPAVSVAPVPALENGKRHNFIMGADVSELYALEQANKKFYTSNGLQENCLRILKNHGVNWIRIRLWNDPTNALGQPLGGGDNNLATDISIAKQAKALGLKVFLDFMYSDFWADPGEQNKPKAWANDHGTALENDVYNFTYNTLETMKHDGVLPNMVQIGNEINNGILWPDGESAAAAAPFLQKAADAVRSADPNANNPNKKIKIVLHLAGDSSGSVGTFTSDLNTWTTGSTKVNFDVIGISYYPYYDGTMAQDANILDTLANTYHKPVIVAENSTGWTLAQAKGNNIPNTFNQSLAETAGYTPTPQGQAEEIRDVINNVANVPNDMGLGMFYWGSDWLPGNTTGWTAGQGSSWSNQALFDFSGRALPSMNVFKLVRTSKSAPPSNFVSADPVTVTTSVGGTLSLPTTVDGQYSDGYYKPTTVSSWDTSTANLSTPGVYTVYGMIGDNPKAAKAIVTVQPVQPKNFVTNPNLASGWTGWTSSDPSVAYAANGGNITPLNGTTDIHYWSANAFRNVTVSQTITGIPNGTYTLSVWGEGSASGSAVPFLYATGYDATNPSATVTQSFTPSGWNIYKKYSVEVTVTSGQCTIGVNFNGAAGDWGDVDDFYFGLPPVSSTATQTQPVTAYAPGGKALSSDATVPFNTPYVMLSSPTPGATIYYTTDGSEPGNTTSSSVTYVYTGPIKIAANTELKVYAVAPGYSQSSVNTYDLTTNDTSTSLVPNGGFNQQGVLSPWTLSGVPEGTDNSTYDFNATQDSTPGVVYEGHGAFKYWSSKSFTFTLSQKVTGLQNGVYRLAAESAGGNNMVLKPDGTATNDPSVATLTLAAKTPFTSRSANVINEGTGANGWNKWNQFGVNNIVVTDGTCTISFTVKGSANYWGYLDNVKLVKVSSLRTLK